jgi:uncharacterized glyoxalase superfamily protein PhnB
MTNFPSTMAMCYRRLDAAAPVLPLTSIFPSRLTDVDTAVARAEVVGATVILEPDDMFWGARYGQVRDPFGHVWAFNAPKQ